MGLYLLQAFVVAIMFAIAVRGSLKAFRTRLARSADLICITLFIFYGMPLVYDWIIPSTVPDHFIGAVSSPRVQFLYPLVLLSTVLLIKLGAWQSQPMRRAQLQDPALLLVPMRPLGSIPLFVTIGWLCLLAPIPAVLILADNPLAYLRYGALVEVHRGATASQGLAIALISIVCTLALLGLFLVYWTRTRYTRSATDPVRWLALLFAFVTVWIHGKRSIILFVLVIIGFVNFFERRLRFRTVLMYAVVGVVFGYLYIGVAKSYTRTPLQYVRGDLSRDYTLRHTINRSGWTDSELVPYRGATYVFFVAAYVPRVYWPSKPWSAHIYLTTDVFGREDDDLLGWAMGVGFMEELIMNFGLVGILGCFLIGKASAWLDRFIYARSSYFAIMWAPLLFGCVFSSSVVRKSILFMVIPALLLSRVFANPRAWVPVIRPDSADGYP